MILKCALILKCAEIHTMFKDFIRIMCVGWISKGNYKPSNPIWKCQKQPLSGVDMFSTSLLMASSQSQKDAC